MALRTRGNLLFLALLLPSLLFGAAGESLHAKQRVGQKARFQNSPLKKVTQMLQDMLAKGKSEKQAELTSFAAYKQFCESTRKENIHAIDSGKDAVEQLSSDLAKAEADVGRLTDEMAELDSERTTNTADLEASTQARKKEKSDYETTHTDYEESVDALGRAVATLKAENAAVPQATSLLELQSRVAMPARARRAIASFLQEHVSTATSDQEDQSGGSSQPQANAYEFQSGSVIDMMQKLKEKFEEEKANLEKKEAAADHQYNMMAQELQNQIDRANTEHADKSSLKATRTQAGAEAKGELARTKAALAEDTKALNDLNAECEKKSTDFEARQQLRGGELDAISKAIEIMAGDEVGAGAEHLVLMQQRQKSPGSAFVQLRSTLRARGRSGLTGAQKQAYEFLEQRAMDAGSKFLMMVATKIGDDPFTKVKKMIKDLIVRLMEEANAESEQKGWCDTELGTNKVTRNAKTEAVASLQADIEELTATSAKLTQELTELDEAIASIDASVATATADRDEEKSRNQNTIKDAADAEAATSQALTVLKEFYSGAADATALVQTAQPYQGMQSASSGVIGMLEVIQGDFARLETETSASEAEAAKAYSDFMGDSSEEKAVKAADVKHKETKRQETDSALNTAKRDLEGTQKELDAALDYFEKLKPSCVATGTSYEDRVTRRKEEIESLQEALKILSGDDIAV